MTHSHWINNNYDFLQRWSKIWAGDRWCDLISYYCIYLDTNWEKFDSIPDTDERIRFTQTWLKSNVRWQNSEFNKITKLNDLEENWEVPDEEQDDLLHIYCETDREDIRDWLIDIHKEWGESGSSKLIKLREIYLGLTTPDKVLWDMYYTNMSSMRDIGHKLNLPLSAVYQMITELKIKIKSNV
jgi:hypothetical protein